MEITVCNRVRFEQSALSAALSAAVMGCAHHWLHGDTPDAVLDAGQYIAVLESSKGLTVPHSEMLQRHRIDAESLDCKVASLFKNRCRQYPKRIQIETLY